MADSAIERVGDDGKLIRSGSVPFPLEYTVKIASTSQSPDKIVPTSHIVPPHESIPFFPSLEGPGSTHLLFLPSLHASFHQENRLLDQLHFVVVAS